MHKFLNCSTLKFSIFVLTSFFLIGATSLTKEPLTKETIIHWENILPADIHPSSIKSIEFVKSDNISSIYKITTKENKVIFQVISVVIKSALPEVAKYACLLAINDKNFCKGVQEIASALIELCTSKVFQKKSKNWSARIDGKTGVGSLVTNTEEEAEEGQKAYEASKNIAKIPWSKPVIRPFKSINSRY